MADTKLNTPVVVNEYADDYDKGLLVPNNITVYSPKADKDRDNYGIVRWSDINSDIINAVEEHNINPDVHKDLFDSKVDKVAEHPGDGMIPATKGEIINNGGVTLSSSTTNLEENISKTVAVTPYGVSIVTNNIDSDEIVTKSQLDTKVDRVTVTEHATGTIDNLHTAPMTMRLMVNRASDGATGNVFVNPMFVVLRTPNTIFRVADSSVDLDIGDATFSVDGTAINYEKHGSGIFRVSNDQILYKDEHLATKNFVVDSDTVVKAYVDTKITEVKKAVPYVFDTFVNFISWLDGSYIREDGAVPSDLNIGDDILIVEENIPDYWVKSKSTPMSITNFAPYESGDYKPTITWLED